MVDCKKISLFLMERTPYHDIFINSLNSDNRIKLMVYYAKPISERRPWDFKDKTASTAYCDTYRDFYHYFIRDIWQEKPDMVIAVGYMNSRILLSYFIMKLLRINFAMWTDVPGLHIPRSLIRNTLRASIFNWLFKNAQAIFTMGQPGVNAFKALGCPEAKIRNLPCTVDLEAPRHLSQESKRKAALLKKQFAPAGETILLGAGRLSKEKGYDLALRAFHRCLAIGLKRKAVLLLAGEGPQRSELEELTENLGLTGRVHFLGWTQPQEMKVLYEAADILIHPARWEPFGVAVLEAMAWGLPVLASDQTMAALDRLTQGESGLIHGMGNVGELSDHMLYLLNNPEKLPIMGAKARQTAEEWPVSRCVQTIIDIA